MAKSPMTFKKKLALILVLAIIVFVVVTFGSNWGTAVSENILESYKPQIKQMEGQRSLALEKCPRMIKKLQLAIPALEKSQDKRQVPLANKLIADCAFHAGDYLLAADYYQRLSSFEPNVGRWHAAHAEALFRAGKAGDALRPSILATQLDPTNFKVKLLNARILAKLNLYHRSTVAYAAAIKVAPYEALESTKQELAAMVRDHEQGGLTEDGL